MNTFPLICFEGKQKRFQEEIKSSWSWSKSTCLSKRTIILQSTLKDSSPQFWNCFFSIQEWQLWRWTVSLEKITKSWADLDAYFTQASLLAVWVQEINASVKGQEVVVGKWPMIKLLIYTRVEFQIQFTKISEL
jgi:hypothetical protein